MTYWITVTGTKYRYGTEPFEPGQKLLLEKEPENEYDNEAIRVRAPGLGCIGYVANSPHTVLGECISAGRLYDKMGDTAVAHIKYRLPQGLVCRVKPVNREKAPAQPNTEDVVPF